MLHDLSEPYFISFSETTCFSSLCARAPWTPLTSFTVHDAGALHGVVVGFQPIGALFKALPTVQVKATFTLCAEVSGEAGLTVSFTFCTLVNVGIPCPVVSAGTGGKTNSNLLHANPLQNKKEPGLA